MLKIKGSQDAISNDLLLWSGVKTQVAVQEVYSIKVHPVSSQLNDGSAMSFNIPSQAKAMLSKVEIFTSFKVKKGDNNLTTEDSVSIINNIANAMFGLVQISINDRTELCQSMRNSYAYQTYFDYCLNCDLDRSDYLNAVSAFVMDSGVTKADAETMVFSGDGVKNKGAAKRAQRIAGSKTVTVCTPLHNPLFTTSKALPTNMKIRISLTKNNDSFLLLADSDAYNIKITDIYLKATFLRPNDIFLNLIEERLAKEAASYFITRPELILKPISESGRILRLNNLFSDGRLPKTAFFAIQRSKDFSGSSITNPYTFIPFGSFNLHVNGVPHFADPLETNYETKDGQKIYGDCWNFLKQLYEVIDKDKKGAGMINSTNFQQNFMVGVSLASDRSGITAGYLNQQMHASTNLTIDLGYDLNIAEDLLLLIFCHWDRVVKISGTREVEIIE